jgi:hypothetical protein
MGLISKAVVLVTRVDLDSRRVSSDMGTGQARRSMPLFHKLSPSTSPTLTRTRMLTSVTCYDYCSSMLMWYAIKAGSGKVLDYI